jgi:hypothetical protein
LTVAPTGHTDSYGNISFNVEIEPQQGAQATPVTPQSPPARQNGKDDYWERKLQCDIERGPQIIRQHSQSMAIEVLKLKHAIGELLLADLAPGKLKALSDYFDNDVLHPEPKPHPPMNIDEREPASEPF